MVTMPASTQPAISIRNVRKTFGPKVAVTNMNLTVDTGSTVAFLGPNGAGKTTTIRMIMSIIFPDHGELSVLGKKSAVESKDRIGYLPEERGVYKKMKVGAFLAYMARLKGVPDRQIKGLVSDWLAKVGLSDCEKKKCEELSKGMQQKVGFVAAILHNPDLVILDEPFSGLDPVNASLMRHLVDEMKRAGKTILFSTHVMAHAEALCDHVLMIHQGDKVLDESMDSIRSKLDPRTVLVEPLVKTRVADGTVASLALLVTAQRLSEIRDIERVVPSTRQGGTLEVTVAEGTDTQEMMRTIAAAVPIRRLELRRVSLEDIFISLVGADGVVVSDDGDDGDEGNEGNEGSEAGDVREEAQGGVKGPIAG